MFPGPYTTGVIVANPTPRNTSWYNTQTTFLPPATRTSTVNTTAASLIAARISYCPLNDDDIADGWTIYDLPNACAALVSPYCWPDPNKPVPSSTRFPAVCTPDRASATSTTAQATNATPAPLEPSTIASCKQYYQVLGGDNCYSIANNFKITLTQVHFPISKKEVSSLTLRLQFNQWNPYVGSDCSKLFLGYYVCILA